MSMELNKIFGAVLLAGLIAMLTGFASQVLVHSKTPEKNAFVVATPAGGAAPADKGAAPAGPAPIAPLMAAAEAGAGQGTAKACAACHSFDKGGANKVGPNLYGILGGPKGHMAGFGYSDALIKTGGQWTYDELNKFLYDPKAYAPGTKMTFAGIKKDADRANVIAYLRSLSDSPQPLPQ
ncbi:c-type cytochrome [Azospirillum doebereinerae]|uniref:Cytochrome c family protein n=1 Tax=Azospirillum doebereinerae TaxID=92933 RepID=A0A433JE15_9PROT|nr:cytochrome c family protein [Azospirillum doebereinerae]MCG5239266.1 cytochrome c family protein [Azospirillum doebereinerae]RUQ75140.1 cytochrome c family protein [Azospirillum doebereinerae]